jgi:DNA polymerase-3 subunit epsilon
MYAIVDIETTGGSATDDRITEIAIYLHDGNEITFRYSQLVNPEKDIPQHISVLTGITNEMVADAPTFNELVDDIDKMTDRMIFVAHNVNFDYAFLREAFKRADKKFLRKKLCTLRLSRKVFPGLRSYGLGSICRHLRIPIEDRHRAGGDTSATVKLFEQILENDTEEHLKNTLNRLNRDAILPPNLSKEQFDKIPEDTGVYYFQDKKGKVLYVGKAKNIRRRVLSHFGDNAGKKLNLKRRIHSIRFEVAGNELLASLLESNEIKRLYPEFNSAQKRVHAKYGLCKYEDRNGYHRLGINKSKLISKPLLSFSTMFEARNTVWKLVQQFELCPKLCGLQAAPNFCHDYMVNMCKGACGQEESVEEYNLKLEEAVNGLTGLGASFFIEEKGRKSGEKSVVVIEAGSYLGFGYAKKNEVIENLEHAKSFIEPFTDNNDIQRILRSYLDKGKRKNVFYEKEQEKAEA